MHKNMSRSYIRYAATWMVILTGITLLGYYLERWIGNSALAVRLNASEKTFTQIIRNKSQKIGRDELNHPCCNITVVSAYFDLGSFQKGGNKGSVFSTNTYRAWGQIFRLMENPLVFYTDSYKFASLMKDIRKDFENRTVISLIDRNMSWAFRRKDKIAQIYHSKGYPKHHPNTVVPAYACAQHAKYDVTARAARANFFKTRYVAWIDVGYFRNRSPRSKHFIISTPQEFNESKIAMNLMYFRSMTYKPERIFKNNVAWVGGGLFLGRTDIIVRYEKQYKAAVDYFLNKKLMNTDQQVIFAMFSDSGRAILKPIIQLQLYKGRPNDWFYLGNSMLNEVDVEI